MFASLSELWLARGDHERATEFADRTLDLATRPNSRKNLAKGWRLRGYIAFARRPLDDAETAFRHALTFAEAIGNPAQRWAAHAALGQVHAARERHDLAGEAYRGAREVLDRVKAGLREPRPRASLDQAPGCPQAARARRIAGGRSRTSGRPAARRRAVSSGRIASVTGSSATP